MPDFATFTGPGGSDPVASITATIHTLSTPTVGDLLYAGQILRSRIRQRTFAGVDANGAPFAGYSQNGPYYLYPNRDVGSTNRTAGTRSHTQAQVRAARATAAKGRHAKVGGVRTPYGIKYPSYGAGKAAHGAPNVNLYGMEQHTHMLDTMLVKCGGYEIPTSADAFMDTGSELAAFEQNQPATQFRLGFYGPEAARAKGNNEGTKTTPPRRFLAVNADDARLMEQAIGERMMMRARIRK